MISDCNKTLDLYNFLILVTNIAQDIFWLDVDASGGTQFSIQVQCSPSDQTSRINELPTADKFPYLFKNFFVENNLPVLKLDFNILSPPTIPHAMNIKNLFKNSNSNGCPIIAYKIIKVIDNLTNKTLTEEDYIN